MRVEDTSLPSAQANLEHDDSLLRGADAGASGEVLRFWESPEIFVVLGRTCKEEDDVDFAATTRDGILVLRRSSGGGTVVQGPGCLNFSLILSKKNHPDLQSINKSYGLILSKILLALKGLGVSGEFRPICDLVTGGDQKKFSGNAQRRGREFILHHGTILYDFDLDLISRYLKTPLKMPEYRLGRPHADFVTNISLRPEAIKCAIADIFLASEYGQE